jgi:hypothetical protein
VEQGSRKANKTVIPVNTSLSHLDTLLVKVENSLNQIQKKERSISRASRDVHNFQRSFRRVEKFSDKIDHVLDKKRRFLRKKFTLRKILTKRPKFIRRIKKRIDKFVKKILKKAFKKLRVRVPRIKSLNQVVKDLEKLQESYRQSLKYYDNSLEEYRKYQTLQSEMMATNFLNVDFLLQEKGDAVPTKKKFYIQSVLTYGKGTSGFWDVPGYDPAYKKGQNMQVWDISVSNGDHKSPDRTYEFTDAGNGFYMIVPSHTHGSGVVEVSGGIQDGTNIHLWDNQKTFFQRFRFKHLGEGRWKIYGMNGKALCLANRSAKNGSNIHLWQDHEGPWMEWVFLDPESGDRYIP